MQDFYGLNFFIILAIPFNKFAFKNFILLALLKKKIIT